MECPMPTNLPDRRKQEVQVSEDSLLYVMVAVTVVAMAIALAICFLTAAGDAGLLPR
jgi:hypothetical protein